MNDAPPNPTPTQYIPNYYAATSQTNKLIWRCIVHSSWILPPVIFVAIKFLLLPVFRMKIAAGFIFAISGTAVILGCLIVSVIALWWAWRTRNRKILIPAIMGLIVSTLFTIAAAGGWTGAVRSYQNNIRARVASKAAKITPVDPKAIGEQAFGDEGWFGTIRTSDIVIGLVEMSDSSTYLTYFHDVFKGDFSIAQISIANLRTEQFLIDPNSFQIGYSDDRELKSLPMNEFLKTAKYSPDQWIAGTGSPWNVPTGTFNHTIFIPLPAGTRLRDAKSISLLIEGVRFEFTGRLYTAAEKHELLKLAKEAQKSNKEVVR